MLRDCLLQLVMGYDAYLGGRRTDAKHPIHKLLHNEIPGVLLSITPEPDHFQFKGSDGGGNVTEVPWVAVLHREITESAQTGYYVVWLLPRDRKSIILELGLGATQFSDLYGENAKALDAAARAGLKALSVAKPIVQNLFSSDLQARIAEGEIPPLGNSYEHKAYGKAAIISVSYPFDSLPEEGRLNTDYVAFVKLYQRLATSPLMPTTGKLVLDEIHTEIAAGTFKPAILKASEYIPRPKISREKKADGRTSTSPRYAKESKKIGDMGEERVFEFLKKELMKAGRNDLAEKTIWHQKCKSDRTPGWDITSYEADTGKAMYVEVKSSTGSKINEVIMTKKEWEAAKSHGDNYFIYLVSNVLRQEPNVEILRNPVKEETDRNIVKSVHAWSVQL